MTVERAMTRIVVLGLVIGLVMVVEHAYNRYACPVVQCELPHVEPTPAIEPTIPAVSLLADRNNTVSAMSEQYGSVPADIAGALIIDCSCVKNPPKEIFEHKGWRYTCAVTQMDYLRSIRCFSCLIDGSRCPWEQPGLVWQN